MTRGKPVRPLILNVGDSEKNEQGGAAADEKMEGEMEEVVKGGANNTIGRGGARR